MRLAKYVPILASTLALTICISLLLTGVKILQVAPPILTYPPTATIGSPLTVEANCIGDAVNFIDCWLALVCNGATVATNYSYTSRSIAGIASITISVTYIPTATGTCIATATDYGWNSYTSFTNSTSATITVVSTSTTATPTTTTTSTTSTSSTTTTSTQVPSTTSTTTTTSSQIPSTTSVSSSMPSTSSSSSIPTPSREVSSSTIAILVIALIALLILARRGSIARY